MRVVMFSIVGVLFVISGMLALRNHQYVEAAVLVVGGNIMGALAAILRQLETK
jgi:hypothetical protein